MAKKRIKRKRKDDNNYPVIRKYRIIIIILIVLFTIGLLIYIYNKKSVYKCSKMIDQSGIGYKVKTNYDIYSEKSKVNYVEITDTIYSDNYNLLKQTVSEYKTIYEEQSEKYHGYTITINENRDKATVIVKIDYSKIDMSKLKKEYSFIEKDESVTVEEAKKIYSEQGAICE